MLVREIEYDVYIMYCDVFRARSNSLNSWYVVQSHTPTVFEIQGQFDMRMCETMIIHSCKMVYSNDNQVR